MAALLRHRMDVDALFYGWMAQFTTQSSTGRLLAPLISSGCLTCDPTRMVWQGGAQPQAHQRCGQLVTGRMGCGLEMQLLQIAPHCHAKRLSPRPRLVLESVPRLEFSQVAPPLRRAPPMSSSRVCGSPPPPPLCPVRQRNELNSSIQTVGLRYDIANRRATR